MRIATVTAGDIERIRHDREVIGMSLDALAAKYPVKRSSLYMIIRGMASDKVARASPSRRVLPMTTPSSRPRLSKSDMGEAARQMISARLMLAGVKVFRPMTEDTPIDLLVIRGSGEVAKIQCKYLFPAKRGCHVLPLTSVRKSGPNRKAVKHRYTAQEVDFFAGYCLDNDAVYVVPFSVAKGRHKLTAWVLRLPTGRNQYNDNSVDLSLFKNRFDSLL